MVAIVLSPYMENYKKWTSLYKNWLHLNNIAPEIDFNQIDEKLISDFNNAYARRTNYDDLLLPAYHEDYYAILPINADLIGYGSEDHHSLSQVVHTLRALAEDHYNQGLLIILDTKEEETNDDTIGYCLTLVEALEAYKQRTGRTIIAFGETFMPKGYYIATGADKIYIENSGTFTLPVGVVLSLYARKNLNNQPLNNNAKLDVKKCGNQLVCGKYKLIPCHNDVGDNFKKCYQDPYIKRIQERKNAIKQQKYWFQNLFSNVVENFMKLGLFASQLRSTSCFIEGITAQSGYYMELVDGYKQKQSIIAEQRYPMKQSYTYFPKRTWQEKWNLIQEPAIEVVFIKSSIRNYLLRSLTPLFSLLAKNKQVKGIVLVIDSPGGYADCHKAIRGMLTTLKEAGKTIYTYTEGYCCSAGYGIGCTAHKIFARETAYIGSIGTRRGLAEEDDSLFSLIVEQLRKYALKSCAQGFIHHVASCRADSLNISKEDFVKRVLSTEARVFDASKALEIGLIDEIGTLETTIADMKYTLAAPNIKVFYREH